MKRFRKNNRGQFVVVAALLIALLTLSVALSIHQINLNRQQLRYEPVEELVLGITSDLDRCLTHALSIATQEYNATRSEESAKSKGYEFISKWVRSIIASHSYLGIKMNINKTEVGLTDVSWDITWGKGVGLSQVYTKFDLDIDAYGFKGWVGDSRKFVMLTIFQESVKLADPIPESNPFGSTTLSFQIVEGRDQSIPIPNLMNDSLKIWAQHWETGGWVPAANVTLSYLGGGNYTVTFSPRINEHTHGVKLTVVTPEDSIYVSAYLYNDIFVTLQSQEENSPDPTNLGRIQLGDANYTLPMENMMVDPGTYLLRYFPEEGYAFLNWTTSGYIEVANPDSNVTSLKIDGDGTITAFYSMYIPPEPKIVILFLDSREEGGNFTHSLGWINGYELPNATSISTGDYTVKYKPCNSSYFFIRWEWFGDVIPASSRDNPTTLRVNGNGTIIAVYGNETPTYTLVSVTLQSLEETLAPPGNLGKIRFSGSLFEKLPVSITVFNGIYLLEYIPAEGYTFLNWTTTGVISVHDPYSSLTSVTVDAGGTITAFYSGCKIFLDSRDWANLSFSLGNITLGTRVYALPEYLTGLPRGDYPLQYTPLNSSYVFLWWEFSGDVVPWNSTSDITTLTMYGDGSVTAVYAMSEPPPPFVGDWSTLYVDAGYTLMPPFMWSGKSSHLPSWASTGKDKQVAVCQSPPTPTIYLAQYVNITAYVRPNPPWNAKDVTLELGFTYNGHYYWLGSGTFPVNSEGVYRLTIDILYGEFPEGYFGVIPEGSVITLTTTVTFFKEPWGTFFLYYGPNNPSRIELF